MSQLLPEELLAEIASRAPALDANNQFCAQDIQALKQTGYLRAFVPAEFGGEALTPSEVSVLQQRLAAAAPATALAVNMHQVWVAVARSLWEMGDHSLRAVLEDAAAGEIFAFGISEPGNDAVLFDSKTIATEQKDGSLTVHGTKVFTTLSPAWTRLGIHARLDDELVFGFISREQGAQLSGGALGAGEIRHPGQWNPLGMRATHSYTTELENVKIAADRIVARMAPYDPTSKLIRAIFANFSLLTAAVYQGIGARAIELAVQALKREKTLMDGSKTTGGADPWRAQQFTEAVLQQRAAGNSLQLLCVAVDSGEIFTQQDIFLELAAAKNQVTAAAKAAVDMAAAISGSAAFDAASELARLRRDVAAAGYHPTTPAQLANTVRTYYGI